MKGKFLGDTKGNRDLNTNQSSGPMGGSGESHGGSISAAGFLGTTKGNRDLPINRTAGVSTGHGGGQHKAGG
jgi:hypothetical protein